MEVFYFKSAHTPDLVEVCKELDIPDGQPFILDEDHRPFTELCHEFGINPELFFDSFIGISDPDAIVGSSFVPEVNQFLKNRTSTSRSSHTWKAEAEQLGIFLRWVKEQGKKWQQITLDDLHTFYQARRLQPSPHTKRQISPKTWNACVGAVHRFYQWGAEKKLIDKVPFTYRQIHSRVMGLIQKNTLTEAVPEEPIRYLTLNEYRIFTATLRKNRNGERDKAFADLLVKTGLRVSEACSLSTDRLPDPEAARYTGRKAIPYKIIGKGNKERRVLIPKSCLREIDRYRSEDRANAIARWKQRNGAARRKMQPLPVELWLTERGTPIKPSRWEEIFTEASNACGIHCTPHMLRHTFAIYYLSALMKEILGTIDDLRAKGRAQYTQLILSPLRTLQRLLGHSRVETTYIYLDTIDECEDITDNAIDTWANEVDNEEVS